MAGNAEALAAYWAYGAGADEILWGDGGDFARCTAAVGKYVDDPEAYCAQRHFDALGIWPATHAAEERAADKTISLSSPVATGLVPYDLAGSRPSPGDSCPTCGKAFVLDGGCPDHGKPDAVTKVTFRAVDSVPDLLKAVEAELARRGIDIAKYSPDEPRDDHGRWTDGGGSEGGWVADPTAAGVNPYGFSIHPYRGTSPKTGYQVAMKGHTEHFPESIMLPENREALSKAVFEHREKNPDVYKAGGKVFIGGWVKDAMLWLEPSERVSSRTEAVRLGQERNQISIWDNALQREIDTGGTGKVDKGQGGAPQAGGPSVPGELGQPDVRAEDGRLPWDGGRTRQGAGPEEVLKSNPYHDEAGRFASADSAGLRYPTDARYARGGTWDAERVATVHRPMLDKMMAGVPLAEHGKQTLSMTGGGYGSGKSTMLDSSSEVTGIPKVVDGKELASAFWHGTPMTNGDAVRADPDAIKSGIPEYQHLADPAHPSPSAASEVHEESSVIAKEAVKEGLLGGRSVVYDTSGDTDPDKLASKVAGFRALAPGLTVNGDYAFPGSTEEAQSRADARAEGSGGLRRFVDPEVLIKNHGEVSRCWQAAAASGTYDTLRLWSTAAPRLPDGTFPPATVIATAVGGRVDVADPAAYAQFVAIGKTTGGK